MKCILYWILTITLNKWSNFSSQMYELWPVSRFHTWPCPTNQTGLLRRRQQNSVEDLVPVWSIHPQWPQWYIYQDGSNKTFSIFSISDFMTVKRNSTFANSKSISIPFRLNLWGKYVKIVHIRWTNSVGSEYKSYYHTCETNFDILVTEFESAYCKVNLFRVCLLYTWNNYPQTSTHHVFWPLEQFLSSHYHNNWWSVERAPRQNCSLSSSLRAEKYFKWRLLYYNLSSSTKHTWLIGVF